MNQFIRCIPAVAISIALLGSATRVAQAGAHLWGVNETFSDASGSIQFVELWNCCTSGETSISGGLGVRSLDETPNSIYVFPANLPAGSSNNKFLLLATAAFASLPGAPTPDGIIPAGSVDTTGDTIQWQTYVNSAMTYGAGTLPTDGIRSLIRNPATPPNNAPGPVVLGASTPKNFAGDTWKPPGVTGLQVGKAVSDGSSLDLAFSTTSCNGHVNHQILHGVRSQLPASAGGAFTSGGAVCAIGAATPYGWVGTPTDPAPGGFVWFLVQATNGATREGAWGRDGDGIERIGPGPGGSSGLCGMTVKDLANTCGQ